MIIWNGWGFIVAIILAACLVGGQFVIGDTWADNRWAQSGALLLAAIITFGVDRLFFSKSHNNSLFFIPLRFWPVIIIALAIALQFATF